jgi:hypothetical protein
MSLCDPTEIGIQLGCVCLPSEIHSPFHRGGEKNLCPSARLFKYLAETEGNKFNWGAQIVTIIIFLTKLTSYQSSVIVQEAHKNSPNM